MRNGRSKKQSIKVEVNPAKKRKKGIIFVLVFLLFGLIAATLSSIYVPKIRLKGEKYVKIDLDGTYEEAGIIVSLNGHDLSDQASVEGDIDTTKPGKYKISYTVKEGIFTKTVVRTVEIVDSVAPVISLVGEKEVDLCPNHSYEEEGYQATDNYDGDLTSKVKVSNSKNAVVYRVSDSSGNETMVKRKVKRIDTEKPVLSLVGPDTKYVLLNSTYQELGFEVSDNCDFDLAEKVEKKGNVDTSKTGTYEITYSVKDFAGNQAKVKRTVVVYDKAASIQGVNKTGVIYLTFDDGPSATITPGILKLLKEKGVKATFFVINHSQQLDYLITQAHEEGHTIGLHSYSHNYKQIYSSGEAYFKDLEAISNKVALLTGSNSKIIRFPGGSSNTISRRYTKEVMTYLTNEVINRGYHYFDWNISSGDAGEAKSKQQVYKNVTKRLNPNQANVVLMHDFENNYKTLNALSDIIDYGLSNGYRFLPLDMTTPLVTHRVNN